MARTARISTPVEAATQPTVVVPVVFDDGVGFIAESVPATLGGQSIPRTLSKEWCTKQGLKPDAGSVTVLRSLKDTNVAFVSIGSTYNSLESYRLAGAAATRSANDASVAFFLPTDGIDDPRDAAQALVTGALLASYTYKHSDAITTFDVVPLGSPLPSVETHDDVTEGAQRGETIAGGINWAKFLVDSPAGYMPPKELARHVQTRLDDDEHVTVDVWSEPRIREERLGGLLGVGEGSAQPCRLVYATYDPSPDVELPHIALVGKGVTFDSGGLSLKTNEGMMAMKTDMTGAAIVMAALSIASRLALQVKITAIAPMTENLPSDRATKPGDVLTIRNGMTIEVLNTDAEGRLILADGLSLAVEANPDAIIDVATLTGAQRVALGDEVGGIFTSTDEMADRFAVASARSGELLWRMPLVRELRDDDRVRRGRHEEHGQDRQRRDDRGGPDTAPLHRRSTVGAHRHRRARTVGRDRGYTTKGATAFGARTVVEFLEAVAEEALD